jgi:hypothetical protein
MRSKWLVILALAWVASANAGDCSLVGADWKSLPHFMARPDKGGLLAQVRGMQTTRAEYWSAHTSEALVLGQNTRLTEGNYHWLQASGSWHGCSTTLNTVHYNPMGKGDAPTDMLLLPKAVLEIIPQPLPREHWRYRGGDVWSFLVRWQGNPLVDSGVLFVDSFGNAQALRSDDKGMVQVAFPDFMPEENADEAQSGHSQQPSSGFAVWVIAPDTSTLTGFDYKYAPNAMHQHSLLYGVGLAMLGMLIAVVLFVRRKKAKKRRQSPEGENA